MRFVISYSCISHTGRRRKNNQDNVICGKTYMTAEDAGKVFRISGSVSPKDETVFGVFDGLGGEECGETASLIAAENASEFKPGEDAAQSLIDYCVRTNADICGYAEKNGISSMGTTAAMLAFLNDGIALCNIGDSRIFSINGGEIKQISKDHVSIAPYGVKPPLLQYLGIPSSEMIIEPYVVMGRYNSGDIYLICSDGVTDSVTPDDIIKITDSCSSVEEAAEELLERALSDGGRDNISIILCEVKREFGFLR